MAAQALEQARASFDRITDIKLRIAALGLGALLVFVVYAGALSYSQCHCGLSAFRPGTMARILVGQNWQAHYFVVTPAILYAAEMVLAGWTNSSLRVLFKPNISTRRDYFYWALQFFKLQDILIFIATLGLLRWLTQVQDKYSLHLLSIENPVLQFAAAFVIGDFCAYWVHRWQHTNRWGWACHKIHHTATDLHIGLSFRFHPLERLQWQIIGALTILLLGGTTTTFAVFTLANEVLGLMQHMRLNWNFGPLGKVLVSPTFHRMHHSVAPEDFNKNFGARLVVWDWLFGSYSTKTIPFDAIGIGETEPFITEFLAPFRLLVPRPILELLRRSLRSF